MQARVESLPRSAWAVCARQRTAPLFPLAASLRARGATEAPAPRTAIAVRSCLQRFEPGAPRSGVVGMTADPSCCPNGQGSARGPEGGGAVPIRRGLRIPLLCYGGGETSLRSVKAL